MRKGQSFINLKVISQADGIMLGSVRDLVYDHEANLVLALLLSDRDMFGMIDAQIVPWAEIEKIGPDAITIKSADSKIKFGQDERVKSSSSRQSTLCGMKVFTTGGKDLGVLVDVCIEKVDGSIVGYEISSGFLADALSGKKFLPAQFGLTPGKDVALVAPEAENALRSLRDQKDADLKTTSDGTAATPDDRLETARAKAQQLLGKAEHAYHEIASASVEKQKQFVIGKTACYEVHTKAEATSDAEEAETLLVDRDEIITAAHADLAEINGVLTSLVASVSAAKVSQGAQQVAQSQAARDISTSASKLWKSAREKVADLTEPHEPVVPTSDQSEDIRDESTPPPEVHVEGNVMTPDQVEEMSRDAATSDIAYDITEDDDKPSSQR